MEHQKQFKVNKVILCFIWILTSYSSYAQIDFRRIIDDKNPLNNCILILQKENETEIIIDSINMFINFSEYSCGEYNDLIYVTWSYFDYNFLGFKNYQINTYFIIDNDLILDKTYCIHGFFYKDLFKNKVSLSFTSVMLIIL